MTATVGVIVPCANGGARLAGCVVSVHSQDAVHVRVPIMHPASVETEEARTS